MQTSRWRGHHLRPISKRLAVSDRGRWHCSLPSPICKVRTWVLFFFTYMHFENKCTYVSQHCSLPSPYKVQFLNDETWNTFLLPTIWNEFWLPTIHVGNNFFFNVANMNFCCQHKIMFCCDEIMFCGYEIWNKFPHLKIIIKNLHNHLGNLKSACRQWGPSSLPRHCIEIFLLFLFFEKCL